MLRFPGCRWAIIPLFLMLSDCAAKKPITERGPEIPAPATHSSFDPLDADELARAVEITRGLPGFPAGGVFAEVSLREPAKGAPSPPREAFVLVMDPPGNRSYEAIVNLADRKLVSWRGLKQVEPPILSTEYDRYSSIVKADPRFQAALKRHGITNPDEVVIEGWAPGPFLPAAARGARLMRGLCYLKSDGPNYYGRPIEGLIPTVNMTSGKLIELTDTGEAPIPAGSQQLDAKSIGTVRTDLRPLLITQPDGPSFRVEGGSVSWQRWRFHFAMHPREGLVLHAVQYEDAGRPRSILYRAAVSEMVVPYGEPAATWAWRSAFDEGEYGLGRMSVTVEKDAPANARLFNASFSDDLGKPYVAKNVVGLYERDGGILWHHSADGGVADVRRSRELVLFSIATIGNYDYLFSWVFRQDGSLEADVAASGIMLPRGFDEARGHATGHRVAAGTLAPHHQHFFNYRLDFDIDGERNSVSELDLAPAPRGKANPFLNAIRMEERPLNRSAGRDLRPEAARKWKVYNPALTTALGYHPGYLLVPGENGLPFALPDSMVRKRAGFLDHQLWVTKFRPEEMHAAGEYPNQSAGGEGLPAWTRKAESLEGQDVVLWYTMGLTHVPRPEEWPVMPAAHIGFKLLPAGFFDRNPGLDVPPG